VILEKIISKTRERVAQLKESTPASVLEKKLATCRNPFVMEEKLKTPGIHVIAEIKRASPSSGDMNLEQDPVEIAGDYLKNGARALSVLTEPEFFRGDIEYLTRIRSTYPDSLLLMKDFIIDEYQLLQGRVAGADAVLLIARVLERSRLKAMISAARALDLSPLIEVHNELELSIALDQGGTLIGVNNRDLNTLSIDLNVSRRLAKLASPGSILVSESGIENGDQIKELSQLGYRGFLVGTTFMKDEEPGKKLAEILSEAK
jgi:indole-3-glycerol phosphate synthase